MCTMYINIEKKKRKSEDFSKEKSKRLIQKKL